MSAIPTAISTGPTLRIEELFVEMLQANPKLKGITIVAASDRTAVVPPTHIFVYCTKAVPILNAGQNYRAKVSIASASNIDDESHATRKGNFNLLMGALTAISSYARPDATLLGWPIGEIGEASTDQQAADVVELNVGAYVAG